MVLYSKCAYGSQFSGEINDLKIRSLVAEILSKNPVSFFLGHPVYVNYLQSFRIAPENWTLVLSKDKRFMTQGDSNLQPL